MYVLAKNMKKAFDGIGCDTAAVNELFTTLSNAEIQGLKRAYEGFTDSSLVDRLKSELSGEHEVLILKILENGRGEGAVDSVMAGDIAKQLQTIIKEGSGMLGGLSNKAERKIIDILVAQSPAQCREIDVRTLLYLEQSLYYR